MTDFHGLYDKNSALKQVGKISTFRMLDFKCLKVQFDVKKANFRTLIPKKGYLKSILVSKTHLCPMFMNYTIRIMPSVMMEGY